MEDALQLRRQIFGAAKGFAENCLRFSLRIPLGAVKVIQSVSNMTCLRIKEAIYSSSVLHFRQRERSKRKPQSSRLLLLLLGILLSG